MSAEWLYEVLNLIRTYTAWIVPSYNIYYHQVLCVHKSFFSGISLDAHLPLFYVEDVITLHIELELLPLTGQQNRKSYEHINYSVFSHRTWNMFAQFLRNMIERQLLNPQESQNKNFADVEFNTVLILTF